MRDTTGNQHCKRGVPTKQVFADIVVKAFEHLDVAKVAHWVVAQENHHDKEIAGAFGTHYHMALKTYSPSPMV